MPFQTASAGRNAERLSTGQAFLEFPFGVQTGMVGTKILPPLSTAVPKGYFSTVTRESILRTTTAYRAARSAYERGTFMVDELSFSCKEYGMEQLIDASERAVYRNDFDADEVARGVIATRMAIAQEVRIATAIFNTSTWTGSALTTDLGTDWDSASSTIVADVLTAKEKVRGNCGLMPNTMVVSAAHIPNFLGNTDLKARLAGAEVVGLQQVMAGLNAILGIPNIYFASGVRNSGKEGAVITSTDIWSDDYCWIGVTATGSSLSEPCVGRTFTWTEDGGEMTWENYWEDQTRCDVWRGRQSTDEKVFDAYFGHLLVIDT